MVTIIDYGIGNLRSIEKAVQRVGAEARRTDEADALRSAERLILPGVGAFGACANEIQSRGLEAPIREAVNAGTPFLGVCVGMQLLFDTGLEKGEHDGLGLLPGVVDHFHRIADGAADDLVVPHMGWNAIHPTRSHPLFDGIEKPAYVYFVHSFHAVAHREDDILATTPYGHDFPSVVQRDNVHGVQFHPEKSQAVGLRMLENFATLPRSELAAAE
ncbi:MAG: imidazole glycerol phosphate synthase subunit HisH [Bacteroidetes bacterium SW_9_63_38]|nr:MAG: imidazole glycerol phosphate synthase subunit HisH [Bacteroidetes bacterium SW_9_63_38]